MDIRGRGRGRIEGDHDVELGGAGRRARWRGAGEKDGLEKESFSGRRPSAGLAAQAPRRQAAALPLLGPGAARRGQPRPAGVLHVGVAAHNENLSILRCLFGWLRAAGGVAARRCGVAAREGDGPNLTRYYQAEGASLCGPAAGLAVSAGLGAASQQRRSHDHG